MPTVVNKRDKKTGKPLYTEQGIPKLIELFNPKEKGAYHAKRAKAGSTYVDKNGEVRYYTDVQRAKSRGFLNALSMQSKIFKKSNPDYIRIKDRKN